MRGGVTVWLVGLLLIIVEIVAIYGAGMYSGIKSASLTCEKDKRDAMQRAIEQSNQIATENAEVAFQHVETVERIKVIYKRIEVKTDEHLAKHPAADSCDIGTDGLQLWNKANASAAPPGG